MDRTAVFVDAGYLFAAGSTLLVQEKLVRGELHLDHAAILKLLEEIVDRTSGLPMLRIYWYDGTSGVPTPQQLALAYQPGVKLRLGFVNQHGQQKGVDALIITDMIQLARNRGMADAVLLTGDEDIRVGMQQAQECGVRVHLVGIAPARENQSGFLRQEADSVLELSLEDVQSFLKPLTDNSRSTPVFVYPPEPSGATAAFASGEAEKGEKGESDNAAESGASAELTQLAQRIAESLSPEEIDAVLVEAGSGSVPSNIDRRLLVEGSKANNGIPLTPELKRLARAAFLSACRARSPR